MSIRREWVCHLAAAMFSIIVVVPAVMIFGDRSDPFTVGHVFFKPIIAKPGDLLTLNYTLTGIHKECDGEVHQRMFDGEGVIWDLGTVPAVYAERTTKPTSTFQRYKKVPEHFARGPALYKARVLYWCNPLQRVFPIEKIIEVPFTVY